MQKRIAAGWFSELVSFLAGRVTRTSILYGVIV